MSPRSITVTATDSPLIRCFQLSETLPELKGRGQFELTRPLLPLADTAINRLFGLGKVIRLGFAPGQIQITLASVSAWAAVQDEIIAIIKEYYFDVFADDPDHVAVNLNLTV